MSNNPLKIAIVQWHADPKRGGAERYADELAKHMRLFGHEVLTLAAEGATRPDVLLIKPRGATRARRYLGFVKQVEMMIGEGDFDIVHAMLPISGCNIYDPAAGFESISLRTVHWWRRWMLAKRHAFAGVEQRMMQSESAPIALVLSNAERARTIAAMGWRADRVVVRRPALGLSHRVERCRGSTSLRCLFVGNDFHRKGLDRAISIVQRLNHATLDVIGSGSSAGFGHGDQVRFLGPRDDVAEQLASHDVLIHPARYEPFGMVISEAISAGCIPATLTHVGASEIIRDGIDGIVSGTTDELRDRLAGLTPECIAKMSGSAIARFEEFLPSTHFRQVESIYRDFLQNGSSDNA